jgi:hypothetical protein
MSSRICCSRYADDNHRQCKCGWQTSPFVSGEVVIVKSLSYILLLMVPEQV